MTKPDTAFQCAICFRAIEGESPFCQDCLKNYVEQVKEPANA